LEADNLNNEKIIFKMGENISEEQLDSDNIFVILRGKIRVIKISSTDEEKTIMFLHQGDIFDTYVKTLNFIASQDAEIYTVSKDIIFNDKEMKFKYENFINTVDQADNIIINAEINSYSTQESSQQVNLFANFNVSVNNCVDNILAFHKFPIPDKNHKVYLSKNIEDFQKQLKLFGFTVEKYYISQNELLNYKLPVILEDEKGFLHWITGKRGIFFVERFNNKSYRLNLSDKNIDQNFIILLVNPLKNRDFYNESPFNKVWYLKLFVNNWILTVQMIISSLITQIFSIGMPVFYMVIFDRVFGRQNLSALNVIAIGMIGLLVFDFLIKITRAYILAHFTEIIDKGSIKSVIYKIFSVPLSLLNKDNGREFIEKFSEITKVNQILANIILVSSMDVIFSVFVVLFLIFLHWKMALISLSPLIPLGIIIFWSVPFQKKRLLQYNKDQKENQINIIEILENNETIRSINATHIFLNKLVEKTSNSFEKNFLARFEQQSNGVFTGFIINIGSLASLYYGAHEVLGGKMSFGVYLAISMLSRSFIGSIMRLFMSLQQYQEILSSIQSLQKIFSLKDETKSHTGLCLFETKGQISFSDVSFSYHPELLPALKNINLEIKTGEKIVLTGKSGSGKTTLIRLVQKLYDPVAGFITIDNLNIKDINIENLRDILGVVLQKTGMFSGTIRDNIILGNPYVSTELLLEILSLTQLDTALMKLPKGLETDVISMGANLSNGLIAQIALSRVLIMNPQILIIDNALSALDISLQSIIFRRLFEKYRHSTCLFVTDLVQVHQEADRIIVLHEGQIIEQGRYTDLIQLKGHYYYLHANNLIERQYV
jgi:ABC-type bacteriocin/lantibiotic exporter with double-glycine peptidase domain